MNRDTIIQLARKAGGDDYGLFMEFLPEIERFAALVAAHEREECAKYLESCDDHVWANTCAAAIRSRGEQKPKSWSDIDGAVKE